jgi:hypothetical protein
MKTIDWNALAAPVPEHEIRWRADSKPKNGRVRAVPYTDSDFVRERLDQVVGPGEWAMTLSPFSTLPRVDKNGMELSPMIHVTCTLNVAGVVRADVGQGDEPKEAASDSLKRAARRFGIGAELWRLKGEWRDCDADGNLIDKGGPAGMPQRASTQSNGNGSTQARQPARRQQQSAPAQSPVPPCPTCGGAMWDNRNDKRNPKAPDFKCKDRNCLDERGMVTGAWVEDKKPATTARNRSNSKALVPANDDYNEFPDALNDDDDDLPF